ncbi:MAG: helix-turn-helix domain-containing protein [Candidatus Sulfotelmatobacter sp.]|jgi:excisionase family DNA binding protein
MNNDQENRTNRLAQCYAQADAGPSSEKANGTHDFATGAKRDINPSEPHPNDDPLGAPMTIREVAVLLGCSVWTIRQRHLRQGLPFFRIGTTGKLLFYHKQVVQWILENQKRKGGEYH